MPLDTAGNWEDDHGTDDNLLHEKTEAHAEGRQGFELWRAYTRAVCLTVNVRAPGVLSRLQAEMRAGAISDEMWEMHLSRVLTPSDTRLANASSPFAHRDACSIVHRHKIRVMRSLENAKDQSRRLRVPLYMIQANDEVVRSENKGTLTQQVHADLLRRVNPEQTKGLPSLLPLCKGMRLLLASKDCVRFGIMKGCPCIIEDNVFADDEILPFNPVAGDPHNLHICQSVCSSDQRAQCGFYLEQNSQRVCLRTLIDAACFNSSPHTTICVQVEHASMNVRRKSLLVMPGDAITVCSAQGNTYDAVIADMQRPPNLETARHGLACYVKLSRARSLEGFLILRPATRKEFSRPPLYLLDELVRSGHLEAMSLNELARYIQALPIHIHPEVLDLFSADAPQREMQMVQARRSASHGNMQREATTPTRRLRQNTFSIASSPGEPLRPRSAESQKRTIEETKDTAFFGERLPAPSSAAGEPSRPPSQESTKHAMEETGETSL